MAIPALPCRSECWPYLRFHVDPNVGHTCASMWIRMVTTPVLLYGSEWWPYLCLCVDPNVGHTCASVWIRMLATPVLLCGSEWWPHRASVWIRVFAATVLISVGCRRKNKLVERSRWKCVPEGYCEVQSDGS